MLCSLVQQCIGDQAATGYQRDADIIELVGKLVGGYRLDTVIDRVIQEQDAVVDSEQDADVFGDGAQQLLLVVTARQVLMEPVE